MLDVSFQTRISTSFFYLPSPAALFGCPTTRIMLIQQQKGDDVLPAALWHKFIPQRCGICCRIKCLYPRKSCVVF